MVQVAGALGRRRGGRGGAGGQAREGQHGGGEAGAGCVSVLPCSSPAGDTGTLGGPINQRHGRLISLRSQRPLGWGHCAGMRLSRCRLNNEKEKTGEGEGGMGRKGHDWQLPHGTALQCDSGAARRPIRGPRSCFCCLGRKLRAPRPVDLVPPFCYLVTNHHVAPHPINPRTSDTTSKPLTPTRSGPLGVIGEEDKGKNTKTRHHLL